MREGGTGQEVAGVRLEKDGLAGAKDRADSEVGVAKAFSDEFDALDLGRSGVWRRDPIGWALEGE
jgi:hypothetical protein